MKPAESEAYFWNIARNETMWDEPKGCEVVWNAAKMHDGNFYYWHTDPS